MQEEEGAVEKSKAERPTLRNRKFKQKHHQQLGTTPGRIQQLSRPPEAFSTAVRRSASRINSQLGSASSTVLAMLALGLDSLLAIGNGYLPKATHVCKAVVAPESVLYG